MIDPDTSDEAKARPRDREAENGEAPVEAGFTTTGVDGSVGGRSLYGMDDTHLHEPTDVDAQPIEDEEDEDDDDEEDDE